MVGTATDQGTSPATASATYACDFCGNSFTEDRAQPACRSCPLGAGCGKVRCPRCGWENVLTPPWVERLRRWLETHGKEAA